MFTSVYISGIFVAAPEIWPKIWRKTGCFENFSRRKQKNVVIRVHDPGRESEPHGRSGYWILVPEWRALRIISN
jgi:hypothetical protein